MKFTSRTILSSCSALAMAAGLLVPTQAFAQDNTAADDLDLDVIYVTARKRPETKLETPVAVSAFSQGDLDIRGVTSPSELSDFVPGFKFENTGTGGQSGRANPNIRFRGVGVQIGLGGASTPGALLWDGAYVSAGTGIVPLIDLAQTEIIKGPQTAFFGRNTFAGAVNFIPAEPGDEFEARVRAAGAFTRDQTGYSVDAVLSGPITDRFGARIAVSTEKTPGTYEYQDGTVLGEENTDAILGMLKFDATDSTVIKLSGYYVTSNDTSALASINGPVGAGDCDATYSGNIRNIATNELTPFTTDLSDTTRAGFCGEIPDWDDENIITPAVGAGAPSTADGTTNFGFAQTVATEFGDDFIDAPDGLGNTYRTWRAHLTVDHEFDNGISASGFFSAGNNKNWGTFDSFYGTPSFGFNQNYGFFQRESKDLSAEARLTSDSEGRLRYMVGVNYYQETSLSLQGNGFAEIAQIFFGDPSPSLGIISDIDSTVLGVFASLDFDITDELTFSAEGRLQNDKLELQKNFDSGLTNAEAMFDPQEQEYTKFMPRVILSYQPSGLDLNVYASFSQSYLQGTTTGIVPYLAELEASMIDAGGLSLENVGFFTPTQKLNSFEIGLKHNINSMFQYSFAAYYMDWSNQTFFVLSPAFLAVSLAGDSEYKGIEAEFTFRPTSWVSITGGYNYVDAKFVDFAATGSAARNILAPGLIGTDEALDASGGPIRYIPAHEGSLSVDFQLEEFTGIESFFRVDAIVVGDFFIDNFGYNSVAGNARINIRAGAQVTENLFFEAYGTNITNDLSLDTNGGTTSNGADRRIFGVPRRAAEWGVRLTANF